MVSVVARARARGWQSIHGRAGLGPVAARRGADKKHGFTVTALTRVLKRAKIRPLMVKAVGGKSGFLGLGRVLPQRIEAVGRR